MPAIKPAMLYGHNIKVELIPAEVRIACLPLKRSKFTICHKLFEFIDSITKSATYIHIIIFNTHIHTHVLI